MSTESYKRACDLARTAIDMAITDLVALGMARENAAHMIAFQMVIRMEDREKLIGLAGECLDRVRAIGSAGPEPETK
jgi:hypothetical protein